GSGLEVAGVDRNIALRRADVAGEPVPVTGVFTPAEKLHGLSDDIDRFALLTVDLVLAPLEAPVDRHRAAFPEVLGAVVRLVAEHRHPEEIGLLFPLPGLAVLAPPVDGDPQLADRKSTRRRAVIWIPRQVAGQYDPVDVSSHAGGSFPSRFQACAESRPASGGNPRSPRKMGRNVAELARA